jgi:diguanylate cyclase (GGDEF)-like protein
MKFSFEGKFRHVLLFSIISLILYAAAFFFMFPIISYPVYALGFVPVVISSAIMGVKAGMWTGSGIILFNFFSSYYLGSDPLKELGSNAAGNIVIILIAFVIGRLHDLSAQLKQALIERSLAIEKAEFISLHDITTGLPNRILYKDYLELELQHAKREDRLLAVLFMDLDRFKQINDTLGHTAGDQVLKEIAIRIQQKIRKSDTFARYGGDEFVLLLPGIGNMSDAAQIARELIHSLEEPFLIQGSELIITGSIGVSFYPQHGDNCEDLIRKADIAMYRAKDQGRNRFVLYEAVISKAD